VLFYVLSDCISVTKRKRYQKGERVDTDLLAKKTGKWQ